MKQIYDVKVRYVRLNEEGTEEKVTEMYVVQADSCTEAEASATNELSTGSEDGFEVLSVKQSAYKEIVPSDDCKIEAWYKVKILFTTFDEDSGTEKRSTKTLLFDALNIVDAIDRVHEFMKDSVSDYRILAVSETNVVDYIQSAEDE